MVALFSVVRRIFRLLFRAPFASCARVRASAFPASCGRSDMTNAQTRIRVTHKEYGWVGEILYRGTIVGGLHTPSDWVRCAWDNGSTTTEHVDDLNIRSEAKG